MSVALLKGRMGKIMAVLLSAVLVLSLLPTTAFAEETVTSYTDGEFLPSTITGSSDASNPTIINVTGAVLVPEGGVAIGGYVKITGGGTIKYGGVYTGEGINIDGYMLSVSGANSELILEDVTVDGEKRESDLQELVLAQGGAKLTINDGAVITGFNGYKGIMLPMPSAVKALSSHIVMNGGSIEENDSYECGTIFLDWATESGAEYSTFVMNGGVVQNNTLTSDDQTVDGGGGFYVDHAILTINGGAILNNAVQNCDGGGIFCAEYGKVIINGGIIEGNTSTDSGNGIYFSAYGDSELCIGGDAKIVDEIDIGYVYKGCRYVTITSALKNPLTFTVYSYGYGTVIAEGAASGTENEYTLTESDLARISFKKLPTGPRYCEELDTDKNQVIMGPWTDPTPKPYYFVSYYSGVASGGCTFDDTAYYAGDIATVAVSSFWSKGHTFLGWTTQGYRSEEIEYYPGDTITMNSDVNLYAVWESSSTYTVSALAEAGGTASGSGTFSDGASTTITATPNTNYLFVGWYEGRTLVSDSATLQVNNITSDKTYTARFESLEYSVTLITGQGVINSGNVTSYIYGTGATLPTNLSYGSLTFDGWYADNAYATSPVTAISATDKGNKTYYAKWRANGVDASSFATTADSGFYSEAPNSPDNEKTGMIVFATQFADILSYGEQVTDFGIFLYKTGTLDENRIQLSKTDLESLGRLKANGGKFHAIAEAIPFAYFDAEVFALPYVVIGGQSYFGGLLTDTVNKAKWLGALVGGNN